jgi:hypothetical protein
MMEMDYTYIMKVQITELVSYDIVSNPSYLSARLYGSFIGYIDKENINIIRKER